MQTGAKWIGIFIIVDVVINFVFGVSTVVFLVGVPELLMAVTMLVVGILVLVGVQEPGKPDCLCPAMVVMVFCTSDY